MSEPPGWKRSVVGYTNWAASQFEGLCEIDLGLIKVVDRPLPPRIPCYLKFKATRAGYINGLCLCGTTGMSPAEKKTVKNEAKAFLEEKPASQEAVARCGSPEDDMAMVRAGTYLWKVRSHSKRYRRKFILDMEEGTLRYQPTHSPGWRRPTHKCVSLSTILDVRHGWQTDNFNKFGIKEQKRQKGLLEASGAEPHLDKAAVDEEVCFSVVYGRNRATLDLVAATPALAQLWVRVLQQIVTKICTLQQDERFNRWITEQFVKADRDNSGTLVFNECLVLLQQLNVKISPGTAFKMFNKANTGEYEPGCQPSLDAREFVAFFGMLMRRTEVEVIYFQYAGRAGEMTAFELENFLRKEQHMEDVTREDCLAYIDACEKQEEVKRMGRLSPNGFLELLLLKDFDVVKAEHRRLYQDMSQPLSSYYIACSHNTYLLGRQVVAESTIEGYVEALKKGCRCLELDCWDGSEGEPVVMHGYALTSKILFRDILSDAILQYAFLVSDYPVILSLEMHCTSEQQKRIAFHLRDVFGDLLYTERVDSDMENLPSPEQLKRKIIIKGRKLIPHGSQANNELDSEEEDEGDSRPENQGRQQQKKLNAKVTDQSLSDVVNVCAATQFSGFKKEGKCYEMVSLAERRALNLSEKQGKELVSFNAKRMSRIYPAGTRADSSNFNPLPFWNAGCQLVALNYQGTRMPVIVNEAKFSLNGRCGYVLKPDFLRLPDVYKLDYDPAACSTFRMPLLKERRKQLQIRVLSAQHLPKGKEDNLDEIVDPYVNVRIDGHPLDKCEKQTNIVKDNGFNPIWNATFRFLVNVPELAFLYFEVKDATPKRQDPLCYAAVPFSSLSEGYRHVSLVDERGNTLEPSSLFVNIKITAAQ